MVPRMGRSLNNQSQELGFSYVMQKYFPYVIRSFTFFMVEVIILKYTCFYISKSTKVFVYGCQIL